MTMQYYEGGKHLIKASNTKEGFFLTNLFCYRLSRPVKQEKQHQVHHLYLVPSFTVYLKEKSTSSLYFSVLKVLFCKIKILL